MFFACSQLEDIEMDLISSSNPIYWRFILCVYIRVCVCLFEIMMGVKCSFDVADIEWNGKVKWNDYLRVDLPKSEEY